VVKFGDPSYITRKIAALLMKLRVLGCSGGQLPGYRLSCFLIDDRLLIDAGSATQALGLAAQSKITDALITHTHLDHVLSLASLADNLYGRCGSSITVHSTQPIIDSLKAHFFNDQIWPDFTEITSTAQPVPVLKFVAIPYHTATQVGAYAVTPVQLDHVVTSMGFFIENRGTTVLHLGDTGPTEEVWSVAKSKQKLGAIIIETSFPNRLQAVADASQHLTPQSLARELLKLGSHDVPIFITHVKPQFRSEVAKDLKALKDGRIRILKDGDLLKI
jgi:cAMP phosphodiesterase